MFNTEKKSLLCPKYETWLIVPMTIVDRKIVSMSNCTRKRAFKHFSRIFLWFGSLWYLYLQTRAIPIASLITKR